MWKWRDWVVDSFNQNKPFDQFTIEQLAGDLLPEATTDQKIASGYVRVLLDGTDEAEALTVQALEDRGVPVAGTVSKPPLDGPFPQLLVLTGSAPRAVHDRALDTLDTLPVVRQIACVLDRIETPA